MTYAAENLPRSPFAREVVWLSSVGSTNDEARRLAETGAPEGTLVVAETQTSGRGRMGRVWQSPRGGVWFSVVLRPQAAPPPGLSVLFAAGACRAIQRVTGQDARFNWPNDVLLLP